MQYRVGKDGCTTQKHPVQLGHTGVLALEAMWKGAVWVRKSYLVKTRYGMESHSLLELVDSTGKKIAGIGKGAYKALQYQHLLFHIAFIKREGTNHDDTVIYGLVGMDYGVHTYAAIKR
jgi:hypothetical protein